jgi:hypothetical protein
MRFISMLTVLLGITLTLGAVDADKAQEAKVMSASDAFDFFKQVDGDWSAKTVTVPIGTPKDKGNEEESVITYQSLANGTTVMGTYYKGSPMQMTDMIHQDGPEMVRLTHYCAVGNQPRMKFVKSDEAGVIQFAFDGGSNMDVESDGHVHDAKVTVLNKDHFEVETHLWTGGKHAMTTYFSISRKE